MSMHSASAPKDLRKRGVNPLMVLVNRLGVYVIVLLLAVIGILLAPGKFLTGRNLLAVVQAVSLLGIVSVGMSFVVFSANFSDMSAPMTIAFSGMISVTCIGLGFWPSLVLGTLAGTLLGVVNGLVIGKLRAHPVIWTMAFNFVVSGIVRWIYGGNQIYPDVVAGDTPAVEAFFALSRSSFLGIPIMVMVMIVMFILGRFVMTRTAFGNQLKVVGSNYEAARLSGINVVRVIVVVFLISSFCASITGLFLASISKTGAYYNGEGYDFRAMTAVLLGGMTLAGGKGDMIGTFGGVLTLGLLTNIMNLAGVSTFQQYLVLGVMFLVIVWINTTSDRKLGRS
jgi:ribose/xylose/arabinose/galactoside ABC-type transport system permease subunit